MSNYFQPNAGGPPNGNPVPPNYYEYGQSAPPSNNPSSHSNQRVAPYSTLRGASNNPNLGSNNYTSYGAVTGQQTAVGATQYNNNMGPPNNQAGFSYASLGGYGSMGGEQAPPMYSMNNYNSMPDPQMNGANNQFKYRSLGGGNPQPQQTNRWNPQQPQPQHYHQHQYLGHQYNQNSMAMSMAPSYNLNAYNELKESRPPPPAAEPPPLPPPPSDPPPAEYSNVHSNTQKRSRWGGIRGEASATAVSGGENKKKSKPPPPAPTPPATNEPDANGPTDNAVNAINALSTLQTRWSAPGAGKSQETEKSQKRQKRKRSKKKSGNDGSSSENDGGKSDVVWIDVDHGPSAKRTQPDGQREFDLASGVAGNKFPSLASQSQGGGDVRFVTLDELFGGDDVRVASLKDVSTSQLTSYAAVLGGALDQNDGANRAFKTQSSGEGEDEEMDISEEEEEEEVKVVHCKSHHQEMQPIRAARADALAQELEMMKGKEKRALKLAELRAKAKLARIKLRMATQKQARGNVAREQNGRPALLNTALSTTPLLIKPKPKLADITALCDNGSLVIEDVGLTGPADEVRYVDSVYSLPEYREDDSNHSINSTQAPTQDKNAQTASTPSEENRKKSESLKQKLHLARLRLEIKKKELERKGLEKKRKALAAVEMDSKQPPVLSSNEGLTPKQPLPLPNQGNRIALHIAGQHMTGQNQQPDIEKGIKEAIDAAPSNDQAHAKLEQLRSRQKELKQKNDIANLRNLIHRQRDMLQAQGQELTESSIQLQSCVDSIKSKQELVEEADLKLDEMNRRKRIVEGMVFRATEQLIAARKTLSQRRETKITER